MIPFDELDSLGPPRLLSRKDLIQVILRLQFDGWTCALEENASLSRERNEAFMNRCLYRGMVHRRNSLGLTNIFIAATPSVPAEVGSLVSPGEPDVIMLFVEFGANDPHAVIECKRLDPLERPRRLRGEYVRAGIDRFVEGRYGRGRDIDFMVAYVLRGDGAAAMQDINTYLRNVGREEDSLQTADEFGKVGLVAHSDHVRVYDDEKFRLLHSFVSFGIACGESQ